MLRLFSRYRVTSFQIIAFGFLLLILTGTALLMLPAANRGNASAGFSDCFFTATSAVCVTGLVVRDTFTCWSPFGQAVILCLIQIGGMGVVTTASAIVFVSGRKIGMIQRNVMQEAISAPQVGGIVRLTRFIVITALAIELAGAAALMPAFVPMYGWGRGIWFSIFHAISAFCNAGFDLMGARAPFASMTGFAQNALVNVTLILLITVGGIGFLVWDDVREHRRHIGRYRLQSKIVLVTSGILILLRLIPGRPLRHAGLIVCSCVFLFVFQTISVPDFENQLQELYLAKNYEINIFGKRRKLSN